MLNENPKVSVCIPTYNSAIYLGEAIKSVLNQTFTDFELIISDNASNDNTIEIVQSFKDNRIKYFRNQENIGMVENWNQCVKKCNGKYITIFHADDIMLPKNLELKIKVLEQNSSVGFVHSNIFTINTSGLIIGNHWAIDNLPCTSLVESGLQVFRKLIIGRNFISAPSVISKRECYEHLGYFNSEFCYVVDWEMWLRIAFHYDIAYISTPLIKYRIHKNQGVNKFFGKVIDIIEELQVKKNIFRKYKNQISGYNGLRREALHKTSIRAIKKGVTRQRNPKIAFQYLLLAFKNYPKIITDRCFWRFFLNPFKILMQHAIFKFKRE